MYKKHCQTRREKHKSNSVSNKPSSASLDDYIATDPSNKNENNCRTVIKPIKSQKEFENRIVSFFVDTLSPFALIENEKYRQTYNFQLFSRKKLVSLIGKRAFSVKQKILNDLFEAKHVAVASDIWKNSKKCFMGVTATVLDKNYERQNYVLCCRRITGVIDYENIASHLTNVFDEYQISDKVIACVTDNGSNYVKAFKVYGLTEACFKVDVKELECEESLENLCLEEEIEFVQCPELESNDELKKFNLPLHLRCGSHTLNLIATTDFNAILSEKEHTNISSLHREAIKRCEILWHAIHLPKSYEIVEKVLGHSLPYPTVVRWNSLYDAIKRILKVHKTDSTLLSTLYRNLGKENERLLPVHINYLQLYKTIMKPIANAIDYLQGEKHVLFGTFIVAIHTLYNCYIDMENENDGPLINEKRILAKKLKAHIMKRYSDELDIAMEKEKVRVAVMAAACHPDLKLAWFRKDWDAETLRKKVHSIKETLITEVSNLRTKNIQKNEENSPTDKTKPKSKQPFFTPQNKTNDTLNHEEAQTEVIFSTFFQQAISK